MESIRAFDAQSGWDNLLDRVAQGETITITRHGQPELRRCVKPGKTLVRQMVARGRC